MSKRKRNIFTKVFRNIFVIIHSCIKINKDNNYFPVGELSKRLIIVETDKNDIKNQNDTLKLNYDELLRKYNDVLAESQRKVRLDDHLTQIGESRR